jgi:serine-type D-Ala-D-Ala carboxypeptidase (penicillin-binding protein 5/6)
MNKVANQLKLTATNYSNPHGLCDKANKSNVVDQARMSAIAMKNAVFREIVGKKHYTTFLVVDCRDLDERKKVKLMEYWWRNSNKLLSNQGFIGCKTGFTSNAGSCLSSYFRDEESGMQLVAVLVGARTNEHRFTETAKLVYWAWAQLLQTHRRRRPESINV